MLMDFATTVNRRCGPTFPTCRKATPRPVLEEMWTAAGFTLVADQSSEMAGSGADYVVLRKEQ